MLKVKVNPGREAFLVKHPPEKKKFVQDKPVVLSLKNLPSENSQRHWWTLTGLVESAKTRGWSIYLMSDDDQGTQIIPSGGEWMGWKLVVEGEKSDKKVFLQKGSQTIPWPLGARFDGERFKESKPK